MFYAARPVVLRWLQVGKKEGATHMLLVEDALAGELVPVYVTPNEDLDYKVSRFDDAHSRRIKAIFDLSSDLEGQLDKVYGQA